MKWHFNTNISELVQSTVVVPLRNSIYVDLVKYDSMDFNLSFLLLSLLSLLFKSSREWSCACWMQINIFSVLQFLVDIFCCKSVGCTLIHFKLQFIECLNYSLKTILICVVNAFICHSSWDFIEKFVELCDETSVAHIMIKVHNRSLDGINRWIFNVEWTQLQIIWIWCEFNIQ